MSAKRPTGNNLLIDEPPLVVLPGLAVAIGLNEAIVLQQLHFLLQNPKTGAVVGGEHYIYNSYRQWHKHFQFFSESTVKRTFLNLERQGLVESIQPNKRDHDHRKYYRVAYDALDQLEGVNTGTPSQGKSRSKRSGRSGQIDPIRTAQIDPLLYRQRQQQRKPQRNPPTPEPSVGGGSNFPGEEIDPTGNTVPGADRTSKIDWVLKAMSHPAAPAFLALVNLTEFPATGRQSLARAFHDACERGMITPGRLQLVVTVKERMGLPTSPAQLIKAFNNVAADAREAAAERLLEIDCQLTPAASETGSLLQMMVGADQQAAMFSLEEAFASGMCLPIPKWLLLATYVKRGVNVGVWAEKLREQVTGECVTDAGVVPFLNAIGIDLSAFGVDEARIEATRTAHHAALMKERSTLSDLLHNESASAMEPAP